MITGQENRGAGKRRPKKTHLSQNRGVSETKGSEGLKKTRIDQASKTSKRRQRTEDFLGLGEYTLGGRAATQMP